LFERSEGCYNTKMQDITFKVDGQKLQGKLFYPEIIKEKNPAVIFVHGWMSNYKGYILRAEALADMGFISLLFDLRGHGESDGKLGEVTAEKSVEDVLASYDFINSLPKVDKNNISIVGASYGGYITAIVSDKRKLDSIVLRVPAIYPNTTYSIPKVKEIDKERKVYRQSIIGKNDNFALEIISKYIGKILLIESEKDQLIPHQVIQNFENAINSNADYEKIIMKDADHSLTKEKWRKEYIEILRKWFKDLI